MTAHSLAPAPHSAPAALGSPQTRSLAVVPFQIPDQITALLSLAYDGSFAENGAIKALSRAKSEGLADAIPALAERALASLNPMPERARLDRLTLLGMSMANGKDADQVRAWLHETGRLLNDLPGDILSGAIDECVKEPGRVWLPSVGEIREKAAAPLQKRERIAARLCHLANLIKQGVEVPDYDPDKPGWEYPRPRPPVQQGWKPNEGETASILAEFGLPSSVGSLVAKVLEPKKSRAEMIAEGREPSPARTSEDDERIMG